MAEAIQDDDLGDHGLDDIGCDCVECVPAALGTTWACFLTPKGFSLEEVQLDRVRGSWTILGDTVH